MEGERRIVTVLFCDVQGSTTLAEQLDPEEWAEIMNGAFERLIAPVYRYEGTLARLMGDGILAFFGAPIAHEDDPRRAVLAGLDIIRDIAPYREQIQRVRGQDFDFGVRVGINTGLVVVGEVGSDLRVEYTAMGDAVNIAARMEQTALVGTVQVASSTFRLVGALFDAEPLGGVEVKGKSQPVEAYRVLGARPGAQPVRGIQGLQSPLVGRERELATLLACVEEMRAGRGRIVSLVGEAGLGKSRLVAELRKSVLGEPLVWLEGRSFSYQTSLPYASFKALFSDHFDLATRTAADQYAQLKTELGPGAPLLASLLGLAIAPEDAEAIRYLQPPQLRAAIFQTVEEWLNRLGQTQRVVLVIDDLHWADPSSLALVEHLATAVERLGLLLMVLFRPDRSEPSWQFHEAAARAHPQTYVSVHLTALDGDQARTLVGNLLHVEDLPERVRGLILQKAEGNPFFVEEVIRSLLDAQLVVRQNDRWRATKEIQSIALPETLAGVIAARLDRLAEEPRRAAQSAAVIGREFRIDTLADVYDQPELLTDCMAELHARELVLARAIQGEAVYGFKHGLTQESAYASLLLSRRRELHRRVADWLERFEPHRAADLAHHLFQAKEDARALPYALAAGEQAAHAYSAVEAIDWFRRTMPLLSTVTDSSLARRAYQGLGAALELTGRAEEAAATYREMQQLARGWGDIPMQVSALNKLGFVQALRLRQFEAAQNTILESERLAREFGDGRGLVEAATVKCGLCLPMGDFPDAVETLGDSVAVARAAPDMREELATALGHLALTMTYSTRFDEAWEAAQECRRVAEELGNRSHVAEVLVFPVPVYLLRSGDADGAFRAAEEGLHIATEIGDAQNIVYGSLMLARLNNLRGEYAAALAAAGTVVGMGPYLGDFATYVLPMGLAELLGASMAVGASTYEQAMQEHTATYTAMEPFFDALSCAELGFCALAQSDLPRAEAWFGRGLEQPSSTWLLERPRLMAGRALVEIARGDPSAAARLLDEGRAFATERAMRHMYPLLDLVQARAAAAANEPDAALAFLRAAERGAAALRMRPILEQVQAGVA